MPDPRRPQRPGRDRHAVLHHPIPGAPQVDAISGAPKADAIPGAATSADTRHVGIIGGGIAGLAAAAVLAERGVRVTVFESTDRLGGRVAAWPIADGHGRTMSRGFHAFFRQYYNLRALLRRADPAQRAGADVPGGTIRCGLGVAARAADQPG